VIRRDFLATALGALTASIAAPLLRAQEMGGMGGMGGMTHSSLAAVDTIPAGASLHELPRLANESSARGVVRAELTARPVQVELIPGTKSTRWLYNGTAVGPLIDVREGDTVEIRFVNHLPQPSTIHWHGLPVPAAQDGNPRERVEPGRSRVYRFTLPPGSAGTYWYHPHPHRLSAEQVFRGLAGPIIVRATNDPLAELPERHLFVWWSGMVERIQSSGVNFLSCRRHSHGQHRTSYRCTSVLRQYCLVWGAVSCDRCYLSPVEDRRWLGTRSAQDRHLDRRG